MANTPSSNSKYVSGFVKMKKVFLIGLPLVFLVGCTSSNSPLPSEVIAYRTPVDAHAGIRRVHPRGVVTGYQKRAVIEPEAWKKENAKPSSWRNQSVDSDADEKPMIKEEPKS